MAKVRLLTGGYGAHPVLECVGTNLSMQTSLKIARPGGAIGRVSVPHDVNIPSAEPTFINSMISYTQYTVPISDGVSDFNGLGLTTTHSRGIF